ncbi:MAG: hypothetical protein DI587_24785 [Variovorax paradoxus]|nr:MAG: hypothetical protein DI583_24785 [Variovorax paradoxus]PZQ05433.1 MAG: hypothetical protein DI587_24785 [Variovorax paradoxus]
MEIGGRERIVADLCRAAERSGVQPVLVTYDVPKPDATVIATPGVQAVALDRRLPGFRDELRSVLARERIDVLHAQGHAAVALAVGATGDIPMLASLHMALGQGWRWLVPLVQGLRSAARVTAVSKDLATRYRWLAGRSIEVIPTGVDLERFTPSNAHRKGSGPFTIGIAARLHPVKRLDVAVESMRILAQRGRRCRLVIAGEGPARARIALLAKGLDVELLGAVTDVPSFLHRLDAFVLPSDQEGTPAALLESMAAGLPCVATAVGGVPDLVGDTGILVPRRDALAMADAIDRLMGQEGLRSFLGASASFRARAYSVQRQADAFADLYQAIAK